MTDFLKIFEECNKSYLSFYLISNDPLANNIKIFAIIQMGLYHVMQHCVMLI